MNTSGGVVTVQNDGAIKQVKAAARSVVAMTSGLHAGAKQLSGSMQLLPELVRMRTPAIDQFLRAVRPQLLLGESRLYVSDEELLAADRELQELETHHRPEVLLECKRVYFQCSEWQRKVIDATG